MIDYTLPSFKKVSAITHYHAAHFSLWKRVFAKPYLSTHSQKITWKMDVNAIATVAWGNQTSTSKYTIRMEDGFIHSLGLGSDLVAPCSQVLDTTGIYFDATRDNDLFQLLNGYGFDEPLLNRAAKLRSQIVAAGITKYNLCRAKPLWQKPSGKTVLLVIGQVGDDASVKLGALGEVKNIDSLLQAVRALNQTAFIVYKPHPDVLSGNRKGLINAQQLCDVVDSEADIISLIEACDEVHTLSSLAGFDALLRGKRVVTYGSPFYAGWGLTTDLVGTIPYRERAATIDMLTAAALILYPVYWDWDTQSFSTPERIVEKLSHGAKRPLTHLNSALRLTTKVTRWCVNVAKFYLAQLKG